MVATFLAYLMNITPFIIETTFIYEYNNYVPFKIEKNYDRSIRNLYSDVIKERMAKKMKINFDKFSIC